MCRLPIGASAPASKRDSRLRSLTILFGTSLQPRLQTLQPGLQVVDLAMLLPMLDAEALRLHFGTEIPQQFRRQRLASGERKPDRRDIRSLELRLKPFESGP